jgi:hypothetical protein
LQVSLGGIDGSIIVGMSGGWQGSFTSGGSGEVIVSFRYNLTQTANYESDEVSQVLVSVDGVLYGEPPNDYVAQVVGDGGGGGEVTTGWVLFQVNLGVLSPASHTLILGGYNSMKDKSNESTEVLIDDVLVEEIPGGDTDGDGVPDGDDSDPLDPTVCRDADGDTCDDCTSGTDNPLNDGLDTDGDGLCDVGDPDDDNDGYSDVDETTNCTPASDPLNPASTPVDSDGDLVCETRDNCPDVANFDQQDGDGDGAGDLCDCAPGDPTASSIPTGVGQSLAFQADGQTLTWSADPSAVAYDVSRGNIAAGGTFTYNYACADTVAATELLDPIFPALGEVFFDVVEPTNVCGSSGPGVDGEGVPRPSPTSCPPLDTDGDGVGDLLDPDDDDDGYSDADETVNCVPASDPLDPASAPVDTDGDLDCDTLDPDDDNDGVVDGSDPAPLDPDVCGDSDADTCDDCAVGTDDFGPLTDADPLNDGPDIDGDGICDAGDPILLEAHFDIDEDGFVYLDDPFRGTNEPNYADGVRIDPGGFTGGGLQVILGGIDGAAIVGMSGGWQGSFTSGGSAETVVSFRYNLTQMPDYENDEVSQVLVSVDGVLYGESPNDYVAQIVGDSNVGTPITTGWVLFQVNLGVLSPGSHTLILGGYNGKKDKGNESTEVLIDDVLVEEIPGA